MELDTGASYSVMGESTLRSILGDSVTIDDFSDITLRMYTGEVLPLVGQATVTVSYKSQVISLPLLIVQGDGAALFGRNWLEHLRLDWPSIHSVSSNSHDGLQNLLQKHQQLFKDELGTLQGVEAEIHVPPHTQPRFYKARPIPYAMKAKVEDELQRLQAAGVISPVEFSDWAAPIVPVSNLMVTSGSVATTVSRLMLFLSLTIIHFRGLMTFSQPCREALFSVNWIYNTLISKYVYHQNPGNSLLLILLEVYFSMSDYLLVYRLLLLYFKELWNHYSMTYLELLYTLMMF